MNKKRGQVGNIYISDTKKIAGDQLKQMLEKNTINGGKIMQTLGEKLRKEGLEKGIKKGIKKGRMEEKIEIAKRLLLENLPIESIIKVTGLTKEEIKRLMH